MKYELVGLCGEGVYSDGVLSGQTTLGGEDEDGKPIGSGWRGNRKAIKRDAAPPRSAGVAPGEGRVLRAS